MFTKGEIVLLPFPFTDLSDTAKVRPAIIVSSDEINDTEDCIFAAITSSIRDDDFSFELKDEDLSHPLRKQSEVRTHKLFTGRKAIIRRVISSLSDEKQQQLSEKIQDCFD